MDLPQFDANQKKPCFGETLWAKIREEVLNEMQKDAILENFLHSTVLQHASLKEVLAFYLSRKLANQVIQAEDLQEIFTEVLNKNPEIIQAAEADLNACYERDPACLFLFMPVLHFKGYQALQVHRMNHCLWERSRYTLAHLLQNRMSEVFGVDIHPAARFGKGIMLDHGTGLVVGETAVLGDNISILHGVTLGGSGKEAGDRHPKIGNGVMIGANASILGNITIGNCARIGAGSVVLNPVPARSTVVGVPARVIGTAEENPAADMKQCL
ncbi:MAG: serine O-acetyltransferase [Neisseriaceae bacterium]|nr:serine O-acetyltransferase [Neisseriaceae bacterium]